VRQSPPERGGLSGPHRLGVAGGRNAKVR
jgi:hypothetical protein